MKYEKYSFITLENWILPSLSVSLSNARFRTFIKRYQKMIQNSLNEIIFYILSRMVRNLEIQKTGHKKFQNFSTRNCPYYEKCKSSQN